MSVLLTIDAIFYMRRTVILWSYTMWSNFLKSTLSSLIFSLLQLNLPLLEPQLFFTATFVSVTVQFISVTAHLSLLQPNDHLNGGGWGGERGGGGGGDVRPQRGPSVQHCGRSAGGGQGDQPVHRQWGGQGVQQRGQQQEGFHTRFSYIPPSFVF